MGEPISIPAPARRPWGVVAILLAAVLVQAGGGVAVALAALSLTNFSNLSDLGPLPAEDAMLAKAQQSVVTVRVAGDHFKASGSGFFIDGKGDVITNYHVVRNAWAVTVVDQSGAALVAEQRGSDLDNDVAEIHVASDAPGLTLRQQPPQVGEQIYVLGNPGGNAPNSVSRGRIVSVNRSATIEGNLYTHLATTDAEVQPGSSGSAVIDRRGRLVGIMAVGSQTAGGLIVDSTFAGDLRGWAASTTFPFYVPSPQIQLSSWNWADKYCNPGCNMTATVFNFGGPGTATVTFSVLDSTKQTTLATCLKQVTLQKGDKATVTCLVDSQALNKYFDVPYQRTVYGDVTVGSMLPLPVNTT